MVEIIRLRQAPRKSTNTDQIGEIAMSKCTTLELDLENFLVKEIGNEFADISIALNESNQPLLAHKCILASRCAYFEAYFRSFMPKERKILVNFLNSSLMLTNLTCFFILVVHYWRCDTATPSLHISIEIHLL